MVKYRKENKELLTYLMFEEQSPEVFLDNYRAEMDLLFADMNTTNLYYIRKSTRRILRFASKYVKFVQAPQLATELLIYFCNGVIEHGIPLGKSTQLMNLYTGQLKKIEDLLSTLHPDLQYDLRRQIRKI